MGGNVKQDPLFYPVNRLRVNSHTIAAKIESPLQLQMAYLYRVYPAVDLEFSGDYNGGLFVCVDLFCVGRSSNRLWWLLPGGRADSRTAR